MKYLTAYPIQAMSIIYFPKYLRWVGTGKFYLNYS